MIGTPKLMPKSLRLIADVAAKPTVALFGGLGLMPAPTRRTCSVIGLLTPFIVRSPSIVASLSFSTTFVEVKWASGKVEVGARRRDSGNGESHVYLAFVGMRRVDCQTAGRLNELSRIVGKAKMVEGKQHLGVVRFQLVGTGRDFAHVAHPRQLGEGQQSASGYGAHF
jgi:hypothetical protein